MSSQMKKLLEGILSIFIWTVIALDTFFVFLTIAILRPFDPDQKISYRIANFWGQSIIWADPLCRVKVSGQSHIKKNKGYVLVSNHMSLADIVCLYCLGKHFKWVAKASLFKIPFFGWTMSLLNYIPLRRGEHGSIRDSFQEAQKWLEKDISVLIFPEGTRSRTGMLGEFKNGAFKLALRTGKPIVPIVIRGTVEALSKGKATVAVKVDLSAKVLPPVDLSPFEPDNYEDLKTKVWNLMNEELTRP